MSNKRKSPSKRKDSSSSSSEDEKEERQDEVVRKPEAKKLNRYGDEIKKLDDLRGDNRRSREPDRRRKRSASRERGNHGDRNKRRKGDEGKDEDRDKDTNKEPAVPSKKRNTDDGAFMTRTGGAYIPPARLRMMQSQIADKSSEAYQRISWEALKKSIHGMINKINISNISIIVRELVQENLVRGRGLLARSIMQAQSFSPTFSHVYAGMVSIINCKFPLAGELILKRLIIQFRRGFKRNDKQICLTSTQFIAHLVNQQVAHEVIALELLTLLLENPTDDAVEVAIGFLKECGLKLSEVSPRGFHAIFERLRSVLHEGQLDKRVHYMIEVMYAVRKDKFKDFPTVEKLLDLIEESDQFTHLLTLDEAVDPEDLLNVFKIDPDFEANEEKYKSIKKEILDESGSSDPGSDGSGDEDEDDEEEKAKKEEAEEENNQMILDNTETNLIALRRTIYLTIQSSLDFEECAHKLLKLEFQPGQIVELCHMILDCCAQQRTYEKFYGLLAQRFCQINKIYIDPFQEIFCTSYDTIHRFETNKLRNVAKFFAHLLHTDAIPWLVLSRIHLNEDETTSSSRIFIKILFQELCEYMGLPKLNERVKDVTLQDAFDGLFPRDNPRNTRFAINFFTSIGLGGLTDDLREHLKVMPKSNPVPNPVIIGPPLAATVPPVVTISPQQSSSSQQEDSSGSSSSDSEDDRRKKKKKKQVKKKKKSKKSKKPVQENKENRLKTSKKNKRNSGKADSKQSRNKPPKQVQRQPSASSDSEEEEAPEQLRNMKSRVARAPIRQEIQQQNGSSSDEKQTSRRRKPSIRSSSSSSSNASPPPALAKMRGPNPAQRPSFSPPPRVPIPRENKRNFADERPSAISRAYRDIEPEIQRDQNRRDRGSPQRRDRNSPPRRNRNSPPPRRQSPIRRARDPSPPKPDRPRGYEANQRKGSSDSPPPRRQSPLRRARDPSPANPDRPKGYETNQRKGSDSPPPRRPRESPVRRISPPAKTRAISNQRKGSSDSPSRRQRGSPVRRLSPPAKPRGYEMNQRKGSSDSPPPRKQRDSPKPVRLPRGYESISNQRKGGSISPPPRRQRQSPVRQTLPRGYEPNKKSNVSPPSRRRDTPIRRIRDSPAKADRLIRGLSNQRKARSVSPPPRDRDSHRESPPRRQRESPVRRIRESSPSPVKQDRLPRGYREAVGNRKKGGSISPPPRWRKGGSVSPPPRERNQRVRR